MEYFVELAFLQGLKFNSITSVVSSTRHARDRAGQRATLAPSVRAQSRSQEFVDFGGLRVTFGFLGLGLCCWFLLCF